MFQSIAIIFFIDVQIILLLVSGVSRSWHNAFDITFCDFVNFSYYLICSNIQGPSETIAQDHGLGGGVLMLQKSDQRETKHHSDSWITQVYYARGSRRPEALKIHAPNSGVNLLL